MILGYRQHVRLAADRQRFQVGQILLEESNEAKIEQPGANRLELLAAFFFVQRNSDARMLGGKLVNQFGKKGVEHWRHGANIDAAGKGAGALLDGTTQRFNSLRDDSRFFQEHDARIGQFDAPACSMKKRRSQRFLKFLNLLTKRRLRHAESLGSATKVEFLRDRDKILELLECHERYLVYIEESPRRTNDNGQNRPRFQSVDSESWSVVGVVRDA
jgi:hypothetical protein